MNITAGLYLSMSVNLTSNIEIMHVLSQQMISTKCQLEGVPVTTGVRNKKTLAPAEGEITAADHDFTKLSLTPSVTLFVDIPNNISESFYDGKVYVCYKDTIFQPSSALRHSTEFFNLMNHQYRNRPLPSVSIRQLFIRFLIGYPSSVGYPNAKKKRIYIIHTSISYTG